MKIEDWPSAASAAKLYRELRELNLETNVAELEAFGFTVVEPDKVGPRELLDQTRTALLDVARRRSAEPIDVVEGSSHQNMRSGLGQQMRFLLWEDPAFETLVLNPAALGLVQYLIGTNCMLSVLLGSIKGPGEAARTGIHTDWGDANVRSLPGEPSTANFHYVLSDYSKENGALCFVPGSHRWRRRPSREESAAWADRAHAVEAPAGSMVVWGDHTWHGSYPRTAPGLRQTVIATYCSPHMQAQEPYRESCTQEALDRNPVRFAALMDQYGMFPIGKQDIDMARIAEDPVRKDRYCSLFDTEPAAGRVTLRPSYDYFDDTPVG